MNESRPTFDFLSEGSSVSRRNFLSGSLLGMAALVAAPKIGDTVFFPNLAYADEDDGSGSSETPFNVGAIGTQSTEVQFSIAVVRPNEVGFMVQDVANKGKGVPGAKVSIMSYAVKDESGEYKTMDATTNEDGKVILKIEEMSENEHGEIEKGKYAFWGKVYIDPPEGSDYRIFETGAMRFRGGNGAVAPTQAIAGKPYPSLLTLDDVDITYTLSRFVVSSKNDKSHTIMARIRGMEKGAEATIKIVEKDKTDAITSAKGTAGDDGICEISMEGQYFQKGNKVCLSGDTEYAVIAEAPNMDITIPTQVQAITGIPSGDELDEDTTEIDTFNYPVSFAGVDLSSFLKINIPAIRSSFNIGFPNPPVQIQINPAGFGMVGIGLPPFPLAGKEGGLSKDAWKKQSILNIVDGFLDAWDNAVEVYRRKKNTGYKKAKFGGDWTLNFRINVLIGWYYRWYVDKEVTKNPNTPFDDEEDQIMAVFQSHQDDLALARSNGLSDALEGTLESDMKPYFGFASVTVGVDLGGSVTWSFFAGPLPAYVELAASVSVDFGYQFSVKLARAYPSIFEEENVEWGGTHTLGLTIVPGIALTLAAGFKGLISGGVTGGISFPFYVGKTWETMPEAGHPDPHTTVGISIIVKIFLQVLCITVDLTVSAYDEPYLYSNWDDEKASSLEGAVDNAHFDPTRVLGCGAGEDILQSFKDFGRPNTPKQFHASAELKATEKPVDEAIADDRTGLENIVFGAYDARLLSGEFEGDMVGLFASGLGSENLVEAPNTMMFLTNPVAEEETDRFDIEELENGVTGASITAHPGIKAISDNDVVMPDSDDVSFHNVYSDDRRDFLICNGRTFLLRIQAVEYHVSDDSDPTGEVAHYRPRLGLSEFVDGKWVNAKFFEIPEYPKAWGFTRMDTYDYDFGATVFGNSIFVVLLSSERSDPDSEEGSIEESVQCAVYTVLTIDVTDDDLKMSDSRSMLAKQLVSLDGSYTDDPSNAAKCHLLTNPVVMMLRDKDNKELYPYFSFVHRVATSPEGLLDGNATCSIEYGLYFRTESGASVLLGNAATDVDPSIIDLQVAQSALGTTDKLWAVHTLAFFPDPDNVQDLYSLTDSGGSTNATGRVDCYSSFPNDDYTVSWKHNVHNASLPQLPLSWPQYGGFLVAHDDHIYQVKVDIDAENADSFDETQLDFDGFTGKLFSIDGNGDFLFFISTMDVDAPIDYENPDAPRGQMKQYLIKAAKVFRDSTSLDAGGYAISQVFPYAELDKPIDMLTSVTVGKDYTTFIASQIVDRDQNLADLRVIQVPHVVKAKATALESLKPFVPPGAGYDPKLPKEDFYLTVKNIGNTMITGFEASLFGPEGGFIEKASVTELDIENMELSMSDFSNSNTTPIPEGEDYIEALASDLDKTSGIVALSASKLSGCLMPGEEIVYKVQYPIPMDWDGFVKVSVDVDDYLVAGYQTTTGARGKRAAVRPAIGDERDLFDSKTRGTRADFELVEGSSSQRFFDPTIDDVGAGEVSENRLVTIATPEENYASTHVKLASADVNLTSQAPCDVVVRTKGGGGDDPSKPVSTGDSTPLLSTAALALGAAGAATVAYSKRRAALEAEAGSARTTELEGEDE